MESFICRPERAPPHPAILLLMDAPGYREELRDMARRIASVGYYVVLPNLYYRRTRDYWLKERTEAATAVMFEHMRAPPRARVMPDPPAFLKFVDAQPKADAKKIGAVGY